MLLTITTTLSPAADLGYLLVKHPDRVHQFDLPFGSACVFYPEATEERCTVALMLEIDPLHVARRGRAGSDAAPLGAYVNDRPYVASSYLSVALAKVFSSAINGRSRERPQLAETPIPLSATVEVVPAPDLSLPHLLFEPLGYRVETAPLPPDAAPGSDASSPSGDNPYLTLKLDSTVKLSDLLTHLYVLLPVLDGAKHYYIGDDEVEKLLRRGGGWLADHPQRELIAARYLRNLRFLADQAIERLADGRAPVDGNADVEPVEQEPETVTTPLNQLRLDAILGALRAVGAASVIDLGCGEGRLLQSLYQDRSYSRILGIDVSLRPLRTASARLRLDELPQSQRERLQIAQASLLYRDSRFSGFDAAVLSEVIEHVDPAQLPRLERVVFGEAKPRAVIVTTPNLDYNARIPALEREELRHPDHRFEWTRAQFGEWAEGVAERFGYRFELQPVGEADPELGSPTQMAVFRS